ncbi:uncharacterized protein LOC130717276 [Lotus japonicus]|uniref:uncharacterized protein LOC130717276 n=1 Tax=Lotus japonicus TaxID=34305 RepID=UPI002589B291|nr:uncharacterized protein LOC130717276 [Lotus japonicus]
MEAPPQPPTPSAAPPLSSVAPPPQPPPHLNYADSVDSSPRSRNTDSWDDPFPPTSKLRLMCSYGGHIVPRPHDKSLCYVGGDTRIVVVERATSLADISTRLSKTFLDGRPFTLKYQLPNEDLDSLISVTTDEDLENMIDEYDRTTTTTASSIKPSRIRLFLFPTKPESAHSIPPQILDSSAKSDDWFLDALNGAGLLNRGFSDSASVNCLLGLDDVVAGNNNNIEQGGREGVEAGGGGGGGASLPGSFANCKNSKQDVSSVPDSPMLETSSSFGSTSSSPALANLPPIRTHAEDGGGGGVRVQQQDQKVLGIEEQFAQLGVAAGVGVGQKQDEGFVVITSPPPPPVPTTLSAPAMGVPINSAVVSGDYQNRVFSDDERSDHGVPVGYRKPPTPTPQQQAQQQLHTQTQSQSHPAQFQQRSSGGTDLPSPDSVSSDSSLANAMSRQKPVIYQEQVLIQSGTTRVPTHSNPVDPKLNVSDPQSRIQVQQHHEQGYLLQQQFDQQQHLLQQQFDQQQHQQQQHQQQQHQQQQHQQQQQQQQQQQYIHGTQFIHHNPANAIPAYYPVYPSQQQTHPQHAQVYYVPARQAQAYNLSMQQANMGESGKPQTPPNPTTLVPQTAAYNNPMRNAPLPKTEMTAAGYRTATGGSPQLVQVPANQLQHQQQYVTYSQIHHPSQSIAPNSAPPANYAYDYVDPAHAQIYYSQPLAPTMPSQYQTMTAAAMVLPEGSSAQLPSDGMKQQTRPS